MDCYIKTMQKTGNWMGRSIYCISIGGYCACCIELSFCQTASALTRLESSSIYCQVNDAGALLRRKAWRAIADSFAFAIATAASSHQLLKVRWSLWIASLCADLPPFPGPLG